MKPKFNTAPRQPNRGAVFYLPPPAQAFGLQWGERMATSAQTIVNAIREAIAANPLALSISVDGQSTTFASLTERSAFLREWEARAAIEAGSSSTKSFVTRGRPI